MAWRGVAWRGVAAKPRTDQAASPCGDRCKFGAAPSDAWPVGLLMWVPG